MIAPIEVHDLVGAPGTTREVALSGTIEGLASELARVPDDAVLQAEVRVESIVEGLLVSGTIRGTWVLRCARCLTENEAAFGTEVHEMFATDPHPEDDIYPFDPAEGLTLEQMIRDAVGVEMPFSPLCRPDCLGLCEICGGDRNLGACPGHERLDPRFAVLSELVLPDLDT